MTEEEVDKYINQIAFSSAGEFLEKYKDQIGSIIGHFGLGFYSAFMVSKKVTIETLSWKEGAKAVKWSCDGSPAYEMEEIKKKDRGTVITLYLDDDSAEFAEKARIEGLLNKYCKFMPVPIVFGKEQEWKDGKYVDTDKDKVINGLEPLWAKAVVLHPPERGLPVQSHRHPVLPEDQGARRHRPEQDLPVLQPDVRDGPCGQYRPGLHDPAARCHRLSGHPAERLPQLSAERRQRQEDIDLHHQEGRRPDRAVKFALLKNTDGKYFSFDEYKTAVEGNQTDKDKKRVYLYATDVEGQYAYVEAAKSKGYDVLLMDCELDSHYVNLLERKLEDTRFARVDSESATTSRTCSRPSFPRVRTTS